MARQPSDKAVEPLDGDPGYEESDPDPSLQGEAGEPERQDVADEPEQPTDNEQDELAAKARLADEYLLLAQRTQADFENYRKRTAREAALAQERGVIRLAKELLPAIDNLERAVQAAEAYASAPAGADAALSELQAAAEGQMLDGLRLLHAEMLAALARNGIEPFSPLGELFDPTRHEAVAHLPLEEAQSGTVAEVYQQGYRLGELVLRPARVLVAA